MTRVRRARLADVAGIADVVKDVWERDVLPDVCEAQIDDDASVLWVVEENGDVVGFASAFLTVGKRRDSRWEIDLVAVRPGSQGRGLGQRLIRAAYGDATEHQAALARAIIRVDNIPSQRAFERVGFATDGEVYRLLLWPPEPGEVPERVVGIPVDTLTYRGLWIEGLEDMTVSEQRAVVGAARSIIAKESRLNAGALIPAAREHLLAVDLRDQAKMHGEYYWFVK